MFISQVIRDVQKKQVMLTDGNKNRLFNPLPARIEPNDPNFHEPLINPAIFRMKRNR